MIFRHPLDFIPAGRRAPLLVLFVAINLACYLVFGLLDVRLRTGAAPAGIVSFELAGSVDRAQAMLDSWDALARLANAFGLGFDFLFMPLYATALSLAVLLAPGVRAGIWAGLGKVLGWGAYAATVFDAVENIALFTILDGGNVAPYPQLAAACAIVKFSLLAVGLVYGLVGGVMAIAGQTNDPCDSAE